MGVLIQIRHVPDRVHRKLTSKAALEGLSLSDYLLREVCLLADLPSVTEFRDRLASRSSPDLKESAARAVRAERDGR